MSSKTSNAAVGMPWRSRKRFMNALEPSSSAAAREGPNALMPAVSRASTRPSTSGTSGPTTTSSTLSRRATATRPATSSARPSTLRATSAVPAFPGTATSSWPSEANRSTSACSRDPEPTTMTIAMAPSILVPWGRVNAGKPPAAIRITRPYQTEDEFLAHELDTISRTGVTLVGAQQRPEGIVLRFELALASGTPLLRGEGRVVGYKATALGNEPGLSLRFTRLDSKSKALVDRVGSMREVRRSIPPPPAASSPVVPVPAASSEPMLAAAPRAAGLLRRDPHLRRPRADSRSAGREDREEGDRPRRAARAPSAALGRCRDHRRRRVCPAKARALTTSPYLRNCLSAGIDWAAA